VGVIGHGFVAFAQVHQAPLQIVGRSLSFLQAGDFAI
jgi:hypothetical protein